MITQSFRHPTNIIDALFDIGEKVTYFPSGDTLLLSNNNCYINRAYIYNPQRRRIIHTFEPYRITLSAFSHKGINMILGNTTDVQLWDPVCLKKKSDIPVTQSSSIVFISENVVAISRYEEGIVIYDIREGKTINKQKSQLSIHSIAFSQQNNILAIPFKKYITLWDVRKIDNNIQLMTLKGHEGYIKQCQFHKYHSDILLTSGNKDNSIWKWNVIKGQGECIYSNGNNSPDIIQSFPNDSRIMYSAFYNVGIVGKGNILKLLSDTICSMELSPSGKYLAVGGYKGKMYIYDVDRYGRQ